MSETRSPHLLPQIPDISDDEITALHQRFGFPTGMSVNFLRSHLEQAATFYWSYQRSPTAKQKAERLRSIHQKTNNLLAELGKNEVLFLEAEPPGLRRLLLELRDKAAQHADRYAQMPPQPGRKRDGLDSFILHLQHTYYIGTGITDRYNKTGAEGGAERGLSQFASAVADLYRINAPDDSIDTAIKRLAREGRLQRFCVGRKSP